MLRAYGGVSGWSMRVKGICARDYTYKGSERTKRYGVLRIKQGEASPYGSIEGR